MISFTRILCRCCWPVLLFLPVISFSQVVRGRVADASTQLYLKKVTLTFKGITTYKTETDTLGKYHLNVDPGNYTVLVECEGYKTICRKNIAVTAGKEDVQDFEVDPIHLTLDTVTIQGEHIPGTIMLPLWSVQRFAGVFNDPARAITSHAAVANTDDQGNHLSIHGLPPGWVQWKMEGVEIVNPNHLENSGTINDLPSLTGGGVSMISAQLLRSSGLELAPFRAVSGNSLGGIFDMKLRKGNDETPERTIHAGLLGLDLCLEGPFKKGGASYSFNTRYSTIGLLSAMGVDFGDEEVKFGDLSWHLNVPTSRGSLRLFGTAGRSSNVFKGKSDSLLVTGFKELQNIRYDSRTVIAGLTWLRSISNSGYIKTSFAWSDKKAARISEPSSDAWSFIDTKQDELTLQKLSAQSYYARRLAGRGRIMAGTGVNFTMGGREKKVNGISSTGNLESFFLQPFISMEGITLGMFELSAGVHSLYIPERNYFLPEPRISLSWYYAMEKELGIRYGHSSQLQAEPLMLPFNTTLLPSSAKSISLNHRMKLRSWEIKNEVFVHMFHKIPVSTSNGFSAFNYFNEYIGFELDQSGRAYSYGTDLTLERYVRESYLILSGTLFNSIYSLDGAEYFKSRFNCGYHVSLSAGNEFSLKNKRKSIGLHARVFFRDGFRESGGTPSYDHVYSGQLPEYYRVDFRLSYSKNRTHSWFIWALDIQNLTNAKSVAYHYYDGFTGETETKHQLGIVPVLSFKVHF